MARTRSTKPTKAKASEEDAPAPKSSRYVLEKSSAEPAKIFIMPSMTSSETRIVTLPNPRTSKPSRYLVCPDRGIFEFTQIAAPNSSPRSWLVETTHHGQEASAPAKADRTEVVMRPELHIATPFDPLFLVIPALYGSGARDDSDGKKRMFVTSDDHLDELPRDASHLFEILRCEKTRARIEARMAAVCDTVEAGDEIMFRLNEKKLCDVLLQKAKKMGEGLLPATMEEKFVHRALEAPILTQQSVVVSSSSQTDSQNLHQPESSASTPAVDSADSQSTMTSAETSASLLSQPSTAASSFSEVDVAKDQMFRGLEATPEIVSLQRQRVAFNFICSRYITPYVASQLQKAVFASESSPMDFSKLDDYLAKLSKLRADAVAARSLNDYSRKHGRDDEDEDEIRAEKKRKLEEEKRKKAGESRGVRDLKKVNTVGMQKLSHFFKKKA